MKKRNSILLSTPYIVWMVIFTLIPLGVVGYYALTDPDTGRFTLDNLSQLGMYLPVLLPTSRWMWLSALRTLTLYLLRKGT